MKCVVVVFTSWPADKSSNFIHEMCEAHHSCAYSRWFQPAFAYTAHAFVVAESVIRSNTSISRNSAINIPLTIRLKARSLRSHSCFSIQSPFMGLIFPFPSGSIDQTALLGFFKVDITTDGNQYLQHQCKNYSHYSPDWPLLHLSVVSILWFDRYLYLHRTKSPSQCQR